MRRPGWTVLTALSLCLWSTATHAQTSAAPSSASPVAPPPPAASSVAPPPPAASSVASPSPAAPPVATAPLPVAAPPADAEVPPEALVASQSPEPAPSPTAPRVPIARRWWFWAALGAAAVGIVIGGIALSPRQPYTGNAQPGLTQVF